MSDMTTAQFNRQVQRAMKETPFQGQVIDLAHTYGWRVAHFRPVRIQRRDGGTYYATPVQADGAGFPDLILVRGERMVVAELKASWGRFEPGQEEWLAALRATAVEVYVWQPTDMDAIEEVLK